MHFRSRFIAGALVAASALACGGEGAVRSEKLRAVFDTSPGARVAHVTVLGVDATNLAALRKAGWTNERWSELVHVAVAGADSISIAGRYAASDTAIEFHPLYPFDAGRAYAVRIDPSKLPRKQSDSAVNVVVEVARPKLKPSTVVTRVLPTAATVPENQLRLYIEFSAPMSRQSGVDFVHLIGNDGREIQHAFLPLDADFWNPDHTRYTVFLDPGRVKQGILPNERLGRPLKAGRAYALVVDTTWHDANGLPLAKPFRAEFYAGPAVTEPIALSTWKVKAPSAGSRAALVLTFPRSLDHGLLQRAVGVQRKGGDAIVGDIAIGPSEKEWRFTPREAWSAGAYDVVVLSILEDVAGNRVGRPFEVDMFERADTTSAPERYTIPFTIR